MVALGKYRVIDGGSSETYKYHRHLLEQALRENTLSDRARAELKRKLQMTIEGEHAARQREEDEAEAERKREKEGGGDKSGQGETGGGAGSASFADGAGMVSREGGVAYEENSEEQQDTDATMDSLVLLLLMAEDICAAHPAADPAAAAMIIDPQDQIAHLYDDEATPEDPGQHLAALERHAVGAGASALQLKVAGDAVDLFRQKYGYEPVGRMVDLKGKAMQRMKKTFSRSQILSYTPPQ